MEIVECLAVSNNEVHGKIPTGFRCLGNQKKGKSTEAAWEPETEVERANGAVVVLSSRMGERLFGFFSIMARLLLGALS